MQKYHPQKEKATNISVDSLYLCRQRPTLPHTFACSTIGPAGLNFRVRDGNGWNPRGKITDVLSSFQPSALSCQPCRAGARFAHIPPASRRCKLVKDPENDLSQLNRLDGPTFIFAYFRFQPSYAALLSHEKHRREASAELPTSAQVLAWS